MNTKEKITLMICITLVIIALILAIGWIFSPDVVFTIQTKMDNNTLEAIQYMNYTY